MSALYDTYPHLSAAEITEVFVPLLHFVNLRLDAARRVRLERDRFLGNTPTTSPFVISISGSVAAGKSTFAQVFQAMLSLWRDHPKVEVVSTDGFLRTNTYLEQRGLLKRKGFPESYDLRRLVDFLSAVKRGDLEIEAPVYSHSTYDVLPDRQTIHRPDILLLEGLNILQTPHGAEVVTSDFFDLSIYIDAEEADVEQWYIERFLRLQSTSTQEPTSYFSRFKDLSHEETIELATRVWRDINLINLRENIRPTRQRADVVLRKQADHSIKEVWFRLV